VNPTNYSIHQDIKQHLFSKEYVAIIPHRSPDGDAIGSALALKKAIQQFHDNVEIFCVDPAPSYTHFLDGSLQISPNLNTNIYKLICFVDCGSSSMSEFETKIPNLFKDPTLTIINIDHHKSNDLYGKYNLVDTFSASTTEILFNLFKIWNITITKNIAQDLLTGIHFDTGSFKHPNTTTQSLKIASELTKLGASNNLIHKQLFKISNSSKLKLWGNVLTNSYISKQKILTSIVTNSDLQKYNSTSKDLEGIIDYLNTVPNKKFSMLLTEDKNNGIKASIRTINNAYDLSKIAAIFGGGGHKMASGFRIEGHFEQEIVNKIV
jgi:phosphoesterase RecJ-like protein